MTSGDHFSSAGDPLTGREIREGRLRDERQQRKDIAVKDLRRALFCLRLEVAEAVVQDIMTKAETVIALLE